MRVARRQTGRELRVCRAAVMRNGNPPTLAPYLAMHKGLHLCSYFRLAMGINRVQCVVI